MAKIKMKFWFRISLFLSFFLTSPCFSNEYRVGVFYFPGWTETPDAWWNPPWEKIKPFPDRQPRLGWYSEGDVGVARQQLRWMSDYGIDFILYDWYWSKKDKPHLEHAIQAYKKVSLDNKPKYCLLWANHSFVPHSVNSFDEIVEYWIENYFNDSQYLTINRKPVVYIFSPKRLYNNSMKFGKTLKELLHRAVLFAKKSGLEGIYFVACTQDSNKMMLGDITYNADFSAISAYNYHRGMRGDRNLGPVSQSYEELTFFYAQSWEWLLENSKLPYFLPVTSGWDRRPWGGSKNRLHDNSFSTPMSFKNHLLAARGYLDKYPDKTRKTVVIYAWNEYGEGAYIEPTKKWSFEYLKAIKEVFKN